MIILLYFDWAGSRAELREYNERIREACEETGIKFLGLHGPMNVKWNWVNIFETEGYDQFLEMARKVRRHPKMTHHVTETLIPQDT